MSLGTTPRADRAVWDRLARSRLPETQQDRPTRVETDVRTLNHLDACRRDVERLVRTACQSNLEFRQEKGPTPTASRDPALEVKLNEMLAETGSEAAAARAEAERFALHALLADASNGRPQGSFPPDVGGSTVKPSQVPFVK